MLLFIMIASVSEMLSFSFGTLYPHQFRPNAQDLSHTINFDAYKNDFLPHAYDAMLGWHNPVSRIDHPRNCAGQRKTYTFDDRGARWSGPKNPVHIVVVGDSYTRGAEVNDDETYPFWLHKLTGLGVANYGVSSSGPLQATLQFERVVAQHPEIKIAILGIMYENLRRFATRLYSIISPNADPFLFQPYLDLSSGETEVRPNPNAPPAMTRRDLEQSIETAFDSDFLRKPAFEWPYSISMIQLMSSRSFKFGIKNRINLLLNRNVQAWFEDADILKGLRYIIIRFNEAAHEIGAFPVIAFLPANDTYLASPDDFIKMFDTKDGLMLNVGSADIDWKRYNLYDPDGAPCHPSPYGYEMIARYITDKLKESGRLNILPVHGVNYTLLTKNARYDQKQ